MQSHTCMGVGRWGRGHPWILKISAKKGCFLSFEWEKTNFTTFSPPRKILPLEKILPAPMHTCAATSNILC